MVLNNLVRIFKFSSFISFRNFGQMLSGPGFTFFLFPSKSSLFLQSLYSTFSMFDVGYERVLCRRKYQKYNLSTVLVVLVCLRLEASVDNGLLCLRLSLEFIYFSQMKIKTLEVVTMQE